MYGKEWGKVRKWNKEEREIRAGVSKFKKGEWKRGGRMRKWKKRNGNKRER